MSKKTVLRNTNKSINASKKRKISPSLAAEIGPEPIPVGVDSPKYRSYTIDFFNWSNLAFDFDEFKSFFNEWASLQNYNIKVLSGVPTWAFKSVGNIAYLLLNERPVSEQLMENFHTNIINLIDHVIAAEDEAPTKIYTDKLSAREKACIEYVEVYSNIDKMVSEGKPIEEITSFITGRQISHPVIKLLNEHYSENEKDYTEAKSIRDRKWKKTFTDLATTSAAIASKFGSVNNNMTNKKISTRKPRTTKVKPAMILIKNLKFCKMDPTLGLESINPTAIIGAKTLVVFNTKTRKFGVIHASGTDGLSVKGTSITNFDAEKSISKTLRKPDEQITSLTSSTAKRMEILFKEIKAVETKISPRISEDILLLKIFK